MAYVKKKISNQDYSINSNETERLPGSMGLENRLHQNEAYIRYDAAGKNVLKYKEILATIINLVIPEYENYSAKEVMDFIVGDSITDEEAIAPDTDTRIIGDDTRQSAVNEANLTYDVRFRVRGPGTAKVHLHFDVELQGDYRPGYKLEKRGIYNISRMISSQLDVVNKDTNYDKLEKVYSIFICVGGVPLYEQNSVSYYSITNTRNIGCCEPDINNYDLMGLILVRIGEQIDLHKVSKVVHFIHGVFYNIKEVNDFIDFSQNEKLRKEMLELNMLGDHLVEYGRKLEQDKVEKANKEVDEERQRTDKERQRADKEKQRADEEKQRADEEKQRADEEKQRADEEKQRADEERHRADTLEAEMLDLRRKLGQFE